MKGSQKVAKKVAEEPAHVGLPVAQPRRVNLFGPPMQPKPQVQRTGALDHANKPSMVNGQLRAYRSGW